MIRTRTWVGGLALAAVLGGAITVVVVTSYTDGARPGEAFFDINTVAAAHRADVELPIGTLQVKIGRPSQEFDTDFDKTTTAADGAAIVPVEWEVKGAQVGISNTTPVYQFQLALVADGRRYDLQAAREQDPPSTTQPLVTAGSVAAVVEGDGEDLELEVEYDGLTQVLHVDSGKIDSGVAAPYYARGGFRTLSTQKSCSAISPADERAFTLSLNKCVLGPVTLLPYVGGLGWVDSSTESWASVNYSLLTGSAYSRGTYQNLGTELRRFDVTLDGLRPTADILRYRNRGTVSIGGYKIFRVSRTPTSLGLTTEMTADGRFVKTGVHVLRTAQTFPLR